MANEPKEPPKKFVVNDHMPPGLIRQPTPPAKTTATPPPSNQGGGDKK